MLAARPLKPLVRQAGRPFVARHFSVMLNQVHGRTEIAARLERFADEVVGTNWADCVLLATDSPFWEAEYEALCFDSQPFLGDGELKDKIAYVNELMDVFYKCEDVRDHINELMELTTRATGLMGCGDLVKGEKVENMEEQAQALAEAYDRLLEEHPAFKPKIEQTVGHGLGLLRSKVKFHWSSGHRYFF
mmetsp:Transcript_33906/g.75852  ORF Transcript_33906/g.75852 Transcript_33906/m.75852 type:complete len:190 (+) Transcript_33906:13-582(+)